jgi:hypothetical protein
MDARKIKRAVLGLDIMDDDAWTAGGLPNIGRVRIIASDPNIGRTDITAAIGAFDRDDAIALKRQNVDRIIVGNAAAQEGRTHLGSHTRGWDLPGAA